MLLACYRGPAWQLLAGASSIPRCCVLGFRLFRGTCIFVFAEFSCNSLGVSLLAQVETIHVFSYAGLGLLFGIISAVVLARKGHGGEAVAALILGFLCFPAAIVAFVIAIIRPDKKQVAQEWRRHTAVSMQLDRQRRQLAELEQQAPPPGYIQCARCGAMNGGTPKECWQCKLEFLHAPLNPPPPQPAPAVRLPHPRR